jgi:hypothetical protein
MKRYTLLILLFSLSLSSAAQVKILDSLRWNIGTSFATSSGYGSAFTTWISPSLVYPLGKKFQISGGFSLINTTLVGVQPYYLESSVGKWSGNLTDLMIYVKGRYSITPNLDISGSAWKRVPLLQDPFPGNKSALPASFSGQGVDMYLNYRIGRSVSIGAGFRYSQRNGAVFNDPFTPDPFRSSGSFTPAFGW